MKLGQEIGLNDCNGIPIKIGDKIIVFDHPSKRYIGTVEWNSKYLECIVRHESKRINDYISMGIKCKYEVVERYDTRN